MNTTPGRTLRFRLRKNPISEPAVNPIKATEHLDGISNLHSQPRALLTKLGSVSSSAAICVPVLICGLTLPGQTQGAEPLVLHVQSVGGCGWMGAQVRPMTRAFAASLGMAIPYGAIFDQPEPGSPAANAGIQASDVLTTINGSPVMLSSDVPAMISAMAPGSVVYLNTFRNRQMIKVSLSLGSGDCVKALIGGA